MIIKKPNDCFDHKNPIFLNGLAVENTPMSPLEKIVFLKKEFRYIMGFLYQDIRLKDFLLKNNILILLKAIYKSPFYSKSIFLYINFFWRF